jgi:mRNA-degrading endonuclease RelE of RelBE toxin-antitoxin system
VSYKILNTPVFKKEIKRLSAKYHSLYFDFRKFLEYLLKDPFQGVALGNNCYKVRFAISSKGRGKSGRGKSDYLCANKNGDYYFDKYL